MRFDVVGLLSQRCSCTTRTLRSFSFVRLAKSTILLQTMCDFKKGMRVIYVNEENKPAYYAVIPSSVRYCEDMAKEMR